MRSQKINAQRKNGKSHSPKKFKRRPRFVLERPLIWVWVETTLVYLGEPKWTVSYQISSQIQQFFTRRDNMF
ncbi:MAG: hypothetical protein EBQ92_07770 [Proteobacteria bacterium]|nr:hypothetical protein [Pseudomonadota bacterium]